MPDDIKKKRFGIWKILGIVVILLLAALIALPFLVDANQFRPRLESEITSALGRDVKVGNLKISILSGGIAADDISIADDHAFSASPFVHAKSLQVGVELKPLLLSRVVHITGISLDQPEITLIHSKSGEWNFSSIGGKNQPTSIEKPAAKPSDSQGPEVTISLLKITNGRLTVIRSGARAKPRVYDKVEIQARDLSYTSVMPFSLRADLPGGGTVKIDGKAGPVNQADASLTPLEAKMVLTRFDMVASGFIEPDAGLSGILDFDGSLDSDGKQIRSKGRARADRLQIVKSGAPASKPVSLDYNLSHNLKDQSGVLSQTSIAFGKAVARFNGTYDMQGESTVLKMKLRGENMPAEDLEAMLPAFGVTLPKGASLEGGALNADLTAEGPIEKITTTGTLGLVNTRLKGFDLGTKMKAVATLAGIQPSSVTEIEKFASELRVAPDGIQVGSLALSVPALGELTGSGVVGANYSMDFKMAARLKTSQGVVGSLTRLAGMKTDANLIVPFFIRGTTSDPKFIPDTKAVATGLLDSVLPGKGAKSGDSNQGQSLGDTLRELFKKKKQ
jgi:AsmA protein